MRMARIFSHCVLLSKATVVKAVVTTQREDLQTISQNEHLQLRHHLQLRISRHTLQCTATHCQTLQHIATCVCKSHLSLRVSRITRCNTQQNIYANHPRLRGFCRSQRRHLVATTGSQNDYSCNAAWRLWSALALCACASMRACVSVRESLRGVKCHGSELLVRNVQLSNKVSQGNLGYSENKMLPHWKP